MLEKDNLECPQHFGRFFVSAFLGAPETSQGVDSLGQGLRWAGKGQEE